MTAAQLCVSFALRTKRMHGYLIAQLERAFGRPVQVSEFSAEILPIPRLDMGGITVGEDPGFGSEYFLRAERMQASLRWMGLLTGHFEFGTMSLTRPSLILVRNAAGRWNLEDWLPPSPTSRPASTKVSYGPLAPPAGPSNYLQKIEFDEGRINFKFENEKRPFAFTNVSGSVEQTGPGRWRLNLEANPWRSGVALQSSGILYVRGDVAGTSARLQPAQVQVHWDSVSLADLFRLVSGNDFGVRGEFALDATASIGAGAEGSAETAGSGKWKYEVQARAMKVHRWDLTERGDNPRVNLQMKGIWDLFAGEVRTEEMTVELPHSVLRGVAQFGTNPNAPWSLHVESAAIVAADALAWYRAFHPGVAEGLAVEQFFSGRGTLTGWPLRWADTTLESDGGLLRVPGWPEGVKIGIVHGSLRGKQKEPLFVVEPVRLTLLVTPVAAGRAEKVSASKAREALNWAELRFQQNASLNGGLLHIDGHLDQVEKFFKIAAAFGKTLNHGWELNGGVGSSVDWNWDKAPFQNGRWNGTITFSKAELQAAGLNLPIELEDARLEWKAGQRSAVIGKTDAFGAAWSGTAAEGRATDGELRNWQFRLHADHLDAAELDRWVGPRARPNWLQRLLPSLLGNANEAGKESELLRRISAEGELSADTVTVEKIKLTKAHAKLSLQNLGVNVQGVEAQWAGANVRGTMQADFSASPKYEIFAEIDQANLAQMPWIPGWAERWTGVASGTLHLTTAGVGREELLSEISGRGDIQVKNLEFHGWDVASSLESDAPKTGVSRWTSGEGEFKIENRVAKFDAIQLNGPTTKLWLTGSLGFAREMTLSFRPAPASTDQGADVGVLQLNGTSETAKATLEHVAGTKAKSE